MMFDGTTGGVADLVAVFMDAREFGGGLPGGVVEAAAGREID